MTDATFCKHETVILKINKNLKNKNSNLKNIKKTTKMESVTNEKLFEAIMDIKNSLNENNKTLSQLTISVDEIKQQHSDFKKELMSLKPTPRHK